MKLARALAGLLLTATLAGCPEEPPPAPPPPPAPTPVAHLTEVEGRVTLERDGGASPATKAPVFEGDVVATATGARALLADERGRELELGEETRFRVGASLTALEVETGEIAFLGDEDGGASWSGASLKTPFGRAVLKDGTAARVRVTGTGLSAEVSIGEIQLDDVDGGVRQAKAGQRLEVGVGAIELEEPPPPEKPAVVTLKVEAGKPQVKAKGAARFTSTAKDTELEAGAAFKVPKGARARLEGSGFVIEVQPGGSGQIESIQQLGGLSAVGLSQAQGGLTVTLDGSTGAKVTLDGVDVSGDQQTTATVTPAGKQKRIEVRAGELTVTRDGVTRTVKAGDTLVVGNGPLDEPQALKPALTVPINRRVRVSADRLGLVGLGLPDDEAHRVQVATDADFHALVVQGVAQKQVVVPAPTRGELFWRTLDDGGQPQAQGRARFGPDTASQREAQAKTDTVAETGLKATIYFQRVVPTLTFTFAASEGAAAYQLRVYRAGELKAPLFEKKVTEPRATVESGRLAEGSYLWSASPLDAAGNETGGGRMNKLDVVYDNSLTTLHIASPKNGDKAGASVVAAGIAPLESTLAINGRPTKLDAQGRFKVPVPKDDVVVFHLKSGGSDSFWVRRLRR